jgi:ADP-ribose pyrophosphatase
MKVQTPKLKQPMPPNAQRVFEGKIFDVYQWEQELYNGKTKTFEKLVRPSTVNIIPITDEGNIIYLEQEQPGKEPYIGFPAGIADKDEDIVEAAYRELLEETGLKSKEMNLWFTYQFSPKIDWIIYTFIAKGCHKVEEQRLDGGEKIKVKYTTFNNLFDVITDERFQDDEVSLELLKAKQNPQKWQILKEMFGN